MLCCLHSCNVILKWWLLVWQPLVYYTVSESFMLMWIFFLEVVEMEMVHVSLFPRREECYEPLSVPVGIGLNCMVGCPCPRDCKEYKSLDSHALALSFPLPACHVLELVNHYINQQWLTCFLLLAVTNVHIQFLTYHVSHASCDGCCCQLHSRNCCFLDWCYSELFQNKRTMD